MTEDVVELLQSLIRIPSVHPEHTADDTISGELNLAQHLAQRLHEMGANVVLENVRENRPNLIARFAPRDGRPRILLGPHLDTVGIAGMTIDPFAATIDDGKIWGRGACDTKGPMAAMLWALNAQRERLKSLPVAIDFVAFMSEESGQWGSKHFIQHHGVDYQFAVVGEPTAMQVVHVTKGSLWATLRAEGKSAHSSQPELGENAIVRLIESLSLLDREFSQEIRKFSHPVLGSPTMNLGVIRGGSMPNIVPNFAEAEMDMRVTPSLAAAGGGLALLKQFIQRHQLPITVVKAHENPPMEIPVDHPMIERLIACADFPCKAVGAPWFSDAAHLSAGGVPSICIGPGSIEQAHTKDEWICIESLRQGAKYFSDWIDSFEN